MRKGNKIRKTYKARFKAEARKCLEAEVTLEEIEATVDAHFEAGGIPELLRKKWSREVITELKEETETIAQKLYKWIKS